MPITYERMQQYIADRDYLHVGKVGEVDYYTPNDEEWGCIVAVHHPLKIVKDTGFFEMDDIEHQNGYEFVVHKGELVCAWEVEREAEADKVADLMIDEILAEEKEAEWRKAQFAAYMQLAQEYNLPNDHTLVNYIVYGYSLGDFLSYVVYNDLCHAACHADGSNLPALADYGRFMMHHAPLQCYGSKDKYLEWKGLRNPMDTIAK